MGFRPISGNAISDLETQMFFMQVEGEAILFSNLRDELANMQSDTFKPLVLAVEIITIPLE
jgi:hypothetical protein